MYQEIKTSIVHLIAVEFNKIIKSMQNQKCKGQSVNVITLITITIALMELLSKMIF